MGGLGGRLFSHRGARRRDDSRAELGRRTQLSVGGVSERLAQVFVAVHRHAVTLAGR